MADEQDSVRRLHWPYGHGASQVLMTWVKETERTTSETLVQRVPHSSSTEDTLCQLPSPRPPPSRVEVAAKGKGCGQREAARHHLQAGEQHDVGEEGVGALHADVEKEVGNVPDGDEGGQRSRPCF